MSHGVDQGYSVPVGNGTDRSRTCDTCVMGRPTGFEFRRRKDGTVVITQHGRQAAVLRGKRAEQFMAKLGSDDQGLMARLTGNYKRGNER
jgi:hypothetical protein